jgi:hypothetical protein
MITSSQSLTNLATALVGFKLQCPKIKFNRTVKFKTKSGFELNYQYADLPNLESVTTPILAANGLTIVQAMGSPGEVTTMLLHSSGEFISSVASVSLPKDADKQELGGITTYLRRYGLTSILGISADADNEPGAQAGNAIKRAASKSATATSPAAGLITLTPEIYGEMVKAINAGKYKDVAARLPNYTLTLAQRTELTTMIESAKQKETVGKQ